MCHYLGVLSDELCACELHALALPAETLRLLAAECLVLSRPATQLGHLRYDYYDTFMLRVIGIVMCMDACTYMQAGLAVCGAGCPTCRRAAQEASRLRVPQPRRHGQVMLRARTLDLCAQLYSCNAVVYIYIYTYACQVTC